METDNTDTIQNDLPAREQPLPLVKQEVTTPSAIDVATALADRIDAGNAKMEELVLRNEKLRAIEVLSGTADAGSIPEQVSKEQIIKDRCNKMLEGIGRSI